LPASPFCRAKAINGGDDHHGAVSDGRQQLAVAPLIFSRNTRSHPAAFNWASSVGSVRRVARQATEVDDAAATPKAYAQQTNFGENGKFERFASTTPGKWWAQAKDRTDNSGSSR
jgi:hypothetical protein